jgi:hypothetical protein
MPGAGVLTPYFRNTFVRKEESDIVDGIIPDSGPNGNWNMEVTRDQFLEIYYRVADAWLDSGSITIVYDESDPVVDDGAGGTYTLPAKDTTVAPTGTPGTPKVSVHRGTATTGFPSVVQSARGTHLAQPTATYVADPARAPYVGASYTVDWADYWGITPESVTVEDFTATERGLWLAYQTSILAPSFSAFDHIVTGEGRYGSGVEVIDAEGYNQYPDPNSPIDDTGHGAPYYIMGSGSDGTTGGFGTEEDTGSCRISTHPEVAWVNSNPDADITASSTRFFLRVRCMIDYEAIMGYGSFGVSGYWAAYISDTPLDPGVTSFEIVPKLKFGLSGRLSEPDPTIKLYANHVYALHSSSGSDWVLKAKAWHPYSKNAPGTDVWNTGTGALL